MTRYSIFGPVTVPGLTIGAIIILTALAVILYQLRRSPGAMQLCLSQVAKISWLASFLMLTMSRTLEEKLFWIHAATATVFLGSILVFEFLIAFFQMKHTAVRAAQFLLRLLFAALFLLVLLDAWQPGFYFRSYTVTGPVIRFEWTFFSLLTFVLAYLLGFINLAIALWYAMRMQGFRRQQALAIAAFPLFITATHALNRFHIFPPFITLVFGMLFGGIYITWLFWRWRFFDILPLAHETISKNMNDGLMVIDDQGYLVELNETARSLFQDTATWLGKPFNRLFADWPELIRLVDSPDELHREVSRQYPVGIRYFMVETSPLVPTAGRVIGKVLLLKEITRQKQDQARLMEQEKALSTLTERNRLGRELHDTQGQFPGYVKTQTQAIRMLLQRGRPEDAGRQMDQLISAADAAFSDARESITGLSIAAQDWDFFGKLQEWLDRFRAMSGIAVQASLPAEKPQLWLKPEAELHLLRIIQESFTNVRKHAGATEISLNFNCDGQQLAVTISDNGGGFDQQATDRSGSYGLKNIKQRLEEMGGSCSISSAVGSGTMLTVLMPWQLP